LPYNSRYRTGANEYFNEALHYLGFAAVYQAWNRRWQTMLFQGPATGLAA
jgi:hypothetical protein